MFIQVENVTKKIKGVTIIDDISMELVSGKIFGLWGINGSGKTMLMRLLSGLVYPTKGKILIDGKVLGRDMTFPESIGLLIENPAFLGRYSGYKNLELLASIKNEIGEKEIRQALERVGLDPYSGKKYKKYSLGMKQRMGIAAAVMEKPDFLILDEPTNALDSEGVQRLKKIISEEKQRGALILLSCHDKELLQQMADEIIFLEEGKVMSETDEGGGR